MVHSYLTASQQTALTEKQREKWQSYIDQSDTFLTVLVVGTIVNITLFFLVKRAYKCTRKYPDVTDNCVRRCCLPFARCKAMVVGVERWGGSLPRSPAMRVQVRKKERYNLY